MEEISDASVDKGKRWIALRMRVRVYIERREM